MFLVLVFLSLSALGFGIEVERALELALEKNLRIKAMEREAKVFDGMRKSALAFGNPELTFESGFLTTSKGGGPRERFLNLLELRQPIPLWGVRQKSAGVVEEQREAFLQSLEVAKRQLIGDTYRKFYEALYRKEVLRIWQEALKTASRLQEFIEKSYQMGETTQLEVFRIRREKGLIGVKVKVAKADYESSLKELSTLLNTEVNDVEGSLEKVRRLYDVNIDLLPQVASIKKEIKSLERQIELEKALAKPTLSTGVILEDSEAGYYGLRATLSAEIPVFYRRQGEILQSLYRKQALAKELEALKLEIKNRLSSVRLRYETLIKELGRFDRELLPNSERELELGLKSYRLRAITLLELSDIRNRYYELLISRAELLREIHRTYAEFISLGGWKR